jgi:Flp pilus assembly protein TadG
VKRRKRRGVVVVLAAVLMVVMLGMIAFAVDVGMITVSRTELQTAADAAALASAAKLPMGESYAMDEANYYVGRNSDTSPATTTTIGQWDAGSRTFNPGLSPFDAVQVQVAAKNQALFFGRVLGTNTYDSGASATAIVRPRDIMLVLDFSGSMNEHHKVDQLKDAVALFFDVLDDNTNQDRVGFARYSTFGELVIPLSSDYTRVNNEVQKTKANGWTNIGDGMALARTEFENNARTNATKMMVIMTDGMANKPENRDPHQYVLDEARLANAEGIDLYTISFGSDADKTLMDEVAEIGHDVHFSVDGTVDQCEQELRAVFVRIATKWKIQLVQ